MTEIVQNWLDKLASFNAQDTGKLMKWVKSMPEIDNVDLNDLVLFNDKNIDNLVISIISGDKSMNTVKKLQVELLKYAYGNTPVEQTNFGQVKNYLYGKYEDSIRDIKKRSKKLFNMSPSEVSRMIDEDDTLWADVMKELYKDDDVKYWAEECCEEDEVKNDIKAAFDNPNFSNIGKLL